MILFYFRAASHIAEPPFVMTSRKTKLFIYILNSTRTKGAIIYVVQNGALTQEDSDGENGEAETKKCRRNRAWDQ